VAFDLQDYKTGLWAIAAPIYGGGNRVVAAASIIIPPTCIDKGSIQNLAEALKNCAHELTQAIGQIS
jgi:DNA-binding IclR family transcriptional regulator